MHTQTHTTADNALVYPQGEPGPQGLPGKIGIPGETGATVANLQH